MAKPKARRLEAICWMDHCTYSQAGWKSEQDLTDLEPLAVMSVGWVIKETKLHVIIAATIDSQDKNFQGEQCLIKSTIVKRWRLKSPIA